MRIVVEQVDTSTDSAGYNSTSSSGKEERTTAGDIAGDVAVMSINRVLMAINPALGALAIGLELGVAAIDKMKTSALDFAMKIEQYAPQIQIANVQRDLNMMYASMKADEIAGKDIGNLIESSSQSDALIVELEARLNKYGARLANWFETTFRVPVLQALADVLETLDETLEGKDLAALRAEAAKLGDGFENFFMPVEGIPELPRGNKNGGAFGLPLGV